MGVRAAVLLMASKVVFFYHVLNKPPYYDMRSWDRLIFIMGIPLLVRRYIYYQTVLVLVYTNPWGPLYYM